MGQIAGAASQFVIGHWGCISTFGLLGYLLGSIVTRKIMAPEFCPQHIRDRQWLMDLREASRGKTAEEKKFARRFFWIRRRGKDKPADGAGEP